MPAFKEVFNTTWKVVLSLVIVLVLAGIAYNLFTASTRTSPHSADQHDADPLGRYDTSDFHTRMPKSAWDKRVAWAVGHHCYFAGMTSEEAMRALGQPTEQNDFSLIYKWLTDDCVRYNGDSCAERKQSQQVVFVHNGYVNTLGGQDTDCYTVKGKNEYLGLRIPSEHEIAAQTRHDAERAVNQKRVGALEAKCEPFKDGSPEAVQSGQMKLPPRECREVLDWTRDAYIRTLYDIQDREQRK